MTSGVPEKYDVVLDGKGYTFLRTLDGSYLSANRHRAEYTNTPTFLARQNVSAGYGDDQQAYWMTVSQNDWSGGEQQKFLRTADETKKRKFWQGANIDVSTPGQAMLRRAPKTLTFAAGVTTTAAMATPLNAELLAASATRLYSVAADGTITDKGLHGVGTTPEQFAACADGGNTFLSAETGGTVGVRKWNGSAFSTFSASGARSLAFVNNTLFGYRHLTSDLVKWDTAGTLTTIYTFKDATGATVSSALVRLAPAGTKMYAFRQITDTGPQLWSTDGTTAVAVVVLPSNFIGYDLVQVNGILYMSGSFIRQNGTNNDYRPAIFYYDPSGTVGLLWEADSYLASAGSIAITAHPALSSYNGGLLFTDDSRGAFMWYDQVTGGIQTIGTYTVSGDTPLMSTSASFSLMTRNQTTGYQIADKSLYATSGSISTSLFDFDSSLNKLFRGVIVDWSPASDGDGGSVDIAYQINGVSGAYTTLQTAAVAGTEYAIGQSGRSISIKVTINKGTSTTGPALKRIYVRAAPIGQTYKYRTYNLDLSSTDEHVTRLQDGTDQPLSGFDQAVNLQGVITATSPFTVTDKFGSFTAICEPANCSILELHSAGVTNAKPGQYIAQITVREV